VLIHTEVACALYTHSIAGCAVSMQRDGLLPLNQHALQVIGDIAYHDYQGAGRNCEERPRLLADVGDRHILDLRSHGLLIVGTSIARPSARIRAPIVGGCDGPGFLDSGIS
jgi:ribulose-5-phosphate 4-epimerase/fuculose-1-phosphate aldolase